MAVGSGFAVGKEKLKVISPRGGGGRSCHKLPPHPPRNWMGSTCQPAGQVLGDGDDEQPTPTPARQRPEGHTT